MRHLVAGHLQFIVVKQSLSMSIPAVLVGVPKKKFSYTSFIPDHEISSGQ